MAAADTVAIQSAALPDAEDFMVRERTEAAGVPGELQPSPTYGGGENAKGQTECLVGVQFAARIALPGGSTPKVL